VLGLGGISVADEMQLQRLRLSVAKQEGDNVRATMLGERQLKLMDMRIQQKEYEMERAMQRLENAEAQSLEVGTYPRTQVISGALEVAADPDGLMGSGEETEGYSAWLDSCQDGKVILILGRRGSGKTALAAKIAEYAMAKYRMPIYWIGLPEQARGLLPNWITLVDSPDQCPMGCFMIIDEAGIQYLSLAFNTDRNRFMRALLMVCRHRHCSLVFAVQSSRDLEYSIIRQADSIIFKQPSLHQPDSERPDIRPLAKKAALIFKEIPKDKRIESAFVFDDDFEGLITSSLPSFWSEKLSNIYANFDLVTIENQVRRGNELKKIVVEETKLLDTASLEKNIMELRRQGCGIEKIARSLGCSTWQVRKCLDRLEQ
jgi:energy-coupling factor transporter ATP-binding protein EcfA2